MLFVLLSNMGTQDNLNDLRVASFSCYLKPIEGVVNMFDANDKFSDMAVLDLHKMNPNIFTARTPSFASEASSWSNNNQTALLQTKSNGRAFGKKWFYGPCATKKSVYVHQSIKQGDQFAFPVLNPAIEIFTTEEKDKKDEKVEELPRMSIEVFGSGTIHKGRDHDIARNLVRKMSILTWDAIPKSKESVVCDDMASEASSDLFEIENISRSGWRESDHDHSCVMSPSTQYAPSEASIEWSVVTASAAEFSSVYSGYDGKHTIYNKNSNNNNNRTNAKTKMEPVKKSQKTGLLGCKSYNSVKVAEPVYMYKTMDKRKH